MSNKVILNFLPPQTLPDLILRHDMKVKWIWRLISKLSICWSFWPCYFWLKPAASGFNMLNYWLPEKRRRHSRRFFLGPAGSWLGFAQPACFTLRHGRLGLIGVFPFILLFTKVFPLVTKDFPFGHQVPLLHLHSFEVKCDEERTNKQTNLRTRWNHEPCLLLV